MKSLATTFLSLILSLSLFAQSEIKWNPVSNNKSEFSLYSLFQLAPDGPRAICASPRNNFPGLKKQEVIVRSYNPDMSSSVDLKFPEESPMMVGVTGWDDYYVIAGNMSDERSPEGWMAQDNRVVITDNGMVPLFTKNYTLHSNQNRFKYIPEVIISSDSNYLILVNYEFQNINKLTLNQVGAISYIDVYDKDLKLVWSDSISSERVFGKKWNVANYYFDFINGQLIASACYENLMLKKDLSTVFVVAFDSPGSFRTLLKKEFAYELFDYRVLFTGDDKVIISGYNINIPAVETSSERPQKCQIFYLSLDLNKESNEPVFKAYEVDQSFCEKFDEGVKRSLKQYYLRPTRLVYNNNKLYYLSDRFVKTIYMTANSDAKSIFGPLSVMMFDLNGNIQWIKNIEKETEMKLPADESTQLAGVFEENEGIRVFYYDNIQNVNSPKLESLGTGLEKRGVVTAVFTPEGTIEKSVISSVAVANVRANLSTIYKINGNTYMFVGKGTTAQNKGDYCGFYSPGQ